MSFLKLWILNVQAYEHDSVDKSVQCLCVCMLRGGAVDGWMNGLKTVYCINSEYECLECYKYYIRGGNHYFVSMVQPTE